MPEIIPLVLRYESWPMADRDAWDRLFQTAGWFDDGGAGHRWSPGTRSKFAQSYGQWLSFLARNHWLNDSEQPADRLTLERAQAYLAECEARLAAKSVANLFTDLLRVAQTFSPTRDWSWLKLATDRLNDRANRRTLPPPPRLTAGQIFGWSIQRLTKLEEVGNLSTLDHAIQYRQALLVGFLISCPVRRRALVAMTVTDHLEKHSTGFTVKFAAVDMKDKRSRSSPLAKALVPFMERYMAVHRVRLMASARAPTSALWVTHKGNPFTADGISADIENTTTQHLGQRLHPHAFRYAAASSIAESDPEHVGIIKDILGHTTMNTAYKYYNRATGISSCNALQSIVEDIRKNMPIMRRVSPIASPPAKGSRGKR